jgi:hypothetical protein
MTLDGLSRARDIEALVYLQQQYAPGGRAAAPSDRNSRASSTQTEFDEALPPLGLSETPAQITRAARWRAWLAGAMRVTTRWVTAAVLTSYRVRGETASTPDSAGIGRYAGREQTPERQ